MPWRSAARPPTRRTTDDHHPSGLGARPGGQTATVSQTHRSPDLRRSGPLRMDQDGDPEDHLGNAGRDRGEHRRLRSARRLLGLRCHQHRPRSAWRGPGVDGDDRDDPWLAARGDRRCAARFARVCLRADPGDVHGRAVTRPGAGGQNPGVHRTHRRGRARVHLGCVLRGDGCPEQWWGGNARLVR